MKKLSAFNISFKTLLIAILAIQAFTKGQTQAWLFLGASVICGVYLIIRLAPRSKNIKPMKTPDTEEPASVSVSMESIVLLQVSCRITEKLKAVYPDSNWEWVCENPLHLVLNGGTDRISVFDANDYNYADVEFSGNGCISLSMVKIAPLSEAAVKTIDATPVPVPKPAPEQVIDVDAWYGIIGQKLLNEIITELNSHGHNKLFIKENGDVAIFRDNTEVIQDRLDNLPAKESWTDLVNVFTRNGLSASSGNDCIQLAW